MAASGFASSSIVSLREPCLARASPSRFPFLSAGPRSLSFDLAPSSSSRFISLLHVSSPRSVKRNAILALDPDFYKIPYVEGVPVGNKLKIWNIPPNTNRDEFMEWLTAPNLKVDMLEFTDDPELNAQGVFGFVEFNTKQDACMAIVELDGRKFKGKCIRMDFVEKRPHEREIGGRRNRPSYQNRDYSSSSYSSGGAGVQDFEPRTTSASRPSSFGSGPGASPSYEPRPYNPPSSNRIFVGNLAWTMDDAGLERLFSAHGVVQEARIMRDRETGRSRGFAFVVMSTPEEMQAAISALDGQMVEGRSLKVNVAAARV